MWLASVDGAISPVAEASIPVTDEGLLRGDGGFEVMRVYGGRPFALDDHFARLGARAPACGSSRTSTRCAPRRSALLEQAGEPKRSCAWS
jgi:branched-chain amino acid aminotransferase